MQKNQDKLTQMVYDNKYKLSFFLCLFLLVVFFVIDEVYGERFMEQSIRLSISLQKFELDSIMWVFSNVVFYGLFFFSFIFYTIRQNAETSFVQLFAIVLMIYAQGILKMFYRRPRPVFLSANLRADFCLCDYGMPSGHSLCTVGIMLFFYDEFSKLYKVSPFLKFTYFFFSLLLTVSVIFSRLYFGVHSFNQCLMGMLFGATVFFLMKRIKDEFLKYLIWPIFQKELFKNKNSIAVLLFLWIAMNYFAFVVWAYVFTMHEYPKIGIDFENCLHCQEPEKTFSSKTLKEILSFNIYFGMLLGIFLDKNKDFKYKGLYEDKSIAKYLLRLLIFFIFLTLMGFTVFPVMDHRFSGLIRSMVVSFITGVLITTVYFRTLELFGLGMKGIKRISFKELV